MKKQIPDGKYFRKAKAYVVLLILLSFVCLPFRMVIAAQVADGARIKVCDHRYLKTPCKSFTGSVLNLAGRKWPDDSSMNNDISSINVRSGWAVTACSKKMFGGRCKNFGPNATLRHSWYMGGKNALNNTIESFEIRRNISLWDGSGKYLSNHPGGPIKPGGGREGVDWAKNAQGITHDANYWYITQEKWLYKYHVKKNLSHNGYLQRVGLPNHCKHFGDLDYYGGYLYVAVEKCPSSQFSSKARIYVYDQSLNIVKAAGLRKPDGKEQGGAGWVAVNPVNGYMYTSSSGHTDTLQVYSRSFRSGDYIKPIYEIKLRHGGKKEKMAGIQGGVFSNNGFLYLSNDNLYHDDNDAGVYIFRIRGRLGYRLKRIKDTYFKKASIYGHELEGITLWDMDADSRGHSVGIPGGQIHYIFLDNDLRNKDDVYIRHIRVSNPARL